MIKPPFKEGQKSTQDARPLQEMSRNSQTSRTVLGSRTPKRMDIPSQWRRVMKRGLTSLQTTFRLVIAGKTLVRATPPRPGQHPACGRRSGPDQPGKEMAHFRDGQGKHSRGTGRPRGRRRNRGTPLCGTHSGKRGESHQHKSDVYVIRNGPYPFESSSAR
jgi:hypothetical protein